MPTIARHAASAAGNAIIIERRTRIVADGPLHSTARSRMGSELPARRRALRAQRPASLASVPTVHLGTGRYTGILRAGQLTGVTFGNQCSYGSDLTPGNGCCETSWGALRPAGQDVRVGLTA